MGRKKVSLAAKITALMAAVTLGLSGCASGSASDTADANSAPKLAPLSELTPVDNPATYEGPSTVLLPENDLQPLDSKVEQKLPVTVTSRPPSGESEVTVKSTERIVSLSLTGALSDFIYAYGFGDKIVGADISTDLPGLDIPVVTQGGHNVDAESILELNPDLVISDGTVGPIDVIEQLRDAGVAVAFVRSASTYEESFEQGQQVADVLGVSAMGAELREFYEAKIEAKIAEIKALVPADPEKLPRVAFLYMRGPGVFFLFGKGTGIDTILDALGAVDVAEEIGWEGHKPMNDEALVAADPNLILVMTKGLESVGGVDGMLETHQAVALTDAGERRRIVDAPDTRIFSGVTRAADTLDGLARAFYAPDSLKG
ncbi:heme/hemin ABC transporter substrate-binding protein [Canibacter zhoujuaniae]|uniref:heme/hemin ABC transporter substrate-binding protein n=1 Tax=Canibacter zhoujuaniae TaxID=2708343 RepID=UPI0014241012|nr:ABC transporter substrate-binding protein [Canibacter zhoujuaniae]